MQEPSSFTRSRVGPPQPRVFSVGSTIGCSVVKMAAAGSGDPAAGGNSALGALHCQKCGQPTTMSLSSATGRNALLRACNGCLATDRWLSRITAKPKNREETEDEKQRRTNGLNIKEDLKKKTPEEKKIWYVEQKVNRQAEDQKKKRTFSSAVGSVEESREVGTLRGDLTKFIPFKKWAAEQMSLKICNGRSPYGMGQARGRPLDGLDR